MTQPLYDLTTVGETMLRISVPPGAPLETAASAALHAAGAESNVAAALAALGRRTAWCSALPDNPPGRLIANALRQAGVDLSMLRWHADGRVGTFFVELESPPAPVRVTYDRAGSCFTRLAPEDIDWARLLSTRLLHLTGITPALSPDSRAVVEEAVARARRAGVPISFDLNYRAKLWQPHEARHVLEPLLDGLELLFIGQADAAQVLGITGSADEQLDRLAQRTGARRIVLSCGSEGVIGWDGSAVRRCPAQSTAILDRLGAGDALAAGVIHGWLDGDFDLGLRRGVALAALALRRHGDIVLCRSDELEGLLEASSSRPQR